MICVITCACLCNFKRIEKKTKQNIWISNSNKVNINCRVNVLYLLLTIVIHTYTCSLLVFSIQTIHSSPLLYVIQNCIPFSNRTFAFIAYRQMHIEFCSFSICHATDFGFHSIFREIYALENSIWSILTYVKCKI